MITVIVGNQQQGFISCIHIFLSFGCKGNQTGEEYKTKPVVFIPNIILIFLFFIAKVRKKV